MGHHGSDHRDECHVPLIARPSVSPLLSPRVTLGIRGTTSHGPRFSICCRAACHLQAATYSEPPTAWSAGTIVARRRFTLYEPLWLRHLGLGYTDLETSIYPRALHALVSASCLLVVKEGQSRVPGLALVARGPPRHLTAFNCIWTGTRSRPQLAADSLPD
ncbi:hypothetical protein CDEST_04842 [Colletotrichum destructivum]|uniref:Uncharacterized protein n=1 Tax=Colletotrichum destructivum TaxID=34406 RepID=A0AAX4IA62_9PEZI|nr:hypothetical protein CDEST_04842 [Colletotrichum destructivum]